MEALHPVPLSTQSSSLPLQRNDRDPLGPGWSSRGHHQVQTPPPAPPPPAALFPTIRLIISTGRGRPPGPGFWVPLLPIWAQIPNTVNHKTGKMGQVGLSFVGGLIWEWGLATGFISFKSSSICPFASNFLEFILCLQRSVRATWGHRQSPESKLVRQAHVYCTPTVYRAPC